jgi:hypothetical protein
MYLQIYKVSFPTGKIEIETVDLTSYHSTSISQRVQRDPPKGHLTNKLTDHGRFIAVRSAGLDLNDTDPDTYIQILYIVTHDTSPVSEREGIDAAKGVKILK